MSEQGQEDADPNVNFNEKKLFDLIINKKFDEAIEFLNNDRLTSQNKTAAVNSKGGLKGTTLMEAVYYGAPLILVQQLCEIGGTQLIMATNDGGWTALHFACDYYSHDPNIDTVKYLVQNGGMDLINKKDDDGKTAADNAKGKGNDSCHNFLREVVSPNRFNDKKIHGGLNDDPKQTPDRLDYDKYAEGIVNVATKAEMSGNYFCVGLYGPWGSGKTKLWNLIRHKLDKRDDAKDGGNEKTNMDGTSERENMDAIDLRYVLFGIVGWLCCLRNDTDNGGLPTHISDDYDAIRDAQGKERNEAVALLFILLLPIWIILGIVIFLLQRYGKCYAIIGKI